MKNQMWNSSCKGTDTKLMQNFVKMQWLTRIALHNSEGGNEV